MIRLKMSSKHLCKMPWRYFEDILKTSSKGLEDVLKISCRRFCKTSWRHLEDVLKMSWTSFCKTPWRRLENNLKTSWQDVLNTSWRRMTKANIFALIKTSWRRPEDGLWRRRQKMSSRRLQGVFVKTNEDVLKMPWRCLADIFARHLEDVLKASLRRLGKTSWRRMTKANIFISGRQIYLEDFFWRRRQKTSSSRWMFAGKWKYQDSSYQVKQVTALFGKLVAQIIA